MRANFRTVSLALAGYLISGLSSAQPATENAQTYSIDSENSILRVYVGKAGVLARMGHNHIVHTKELTGEITLATDALNSSASFSFPVQSFVVDDAEERRLAGAEFESQPGESAIAGTRTNMLSEGILNAAMFPGISVRATPTEITDETWSFALELEFLGQTIELVVPAQVILNADSLAVAAEFSLDHSDLGLESFSAVGGSLRVAEQLDFKLNIVAKPQ